MADDNKALVERLRASECIAYYDDEPGMVADEELLNEVADRIEVLSAENERLRERIERLRKALYAAYDDEPGWCDLTRAALGETE